MKKPCIKFVSGQILPDAMKKASSCIRRSLMNIPYNELAWFNLAAAYQGLKLYEKSIDAYQYALAIDEKFDYAYRNMGDAYIRLRKYKEAIEALEKVLELSKPEEVIYEAIGHCYDQAEKLCPGKISLPESIPPESGRQQTFL